MTETRVIDWDAIERDYRAGIMTLREIAAKHGPSHVAIQKRAKKYDWPKNLTAKIEQKREELVNKALVNAEVNKLNDVNLIKSKAELQAGALLEESEEIKRLKSIADSFEDELNNMPLDANNTPLDLQKRTSILKQLTEVKEKIINLRRRNFGINDNANGDADRKGAVTNVTYTIIDPQSVNIQQAVSVKHTVVDESRVYA